jgi:hypothetical protein
MTVAPAKTILLNPESKEIHAAVGSAIDLYAHMEGSQSMLLETILAVPPHMASIVFFSVQNVRSRNEMIQSLLSARYDKNMINFGEHVRSLFSHFLCFGMPLFIGSHAWLYIAIKKVRSLGTTMNWDTKPLLLSAESKRQTFKISSKTVAISSKRFSRSIAT